MMNNVLAGLGLYVAAALGPYWLFLGLSLVVVLWRKGYAPLFAGVVIDLQFAFLDGLLPWYVVGACAMCLLAEIVRPYIYVERLV